MTLTISRITAASLGVAACGSSSSSSTASSTSGGAASTSSGASSSSGGSASVSGAGSTFATPIYQQWEDVGEVDRAGFLSAYSPAWTAAAGKPDKTVKWPTVTGAQGNSGVAAAIKVPPDLTISVINSPNPAAYPITSQTFVVVYKDMCKAGVPAPVLAKDRAQLKKLTCNGSPLS